MGQNATEERNKYDNWKRHQKLQQQIKSIHTRVKKRNDYYSIYKKKKKWIKRYGKGVSELKNKTIYSKQQQNTTYSS